MSESGRTPESIEEVVSAFEAELIAEGSADFSRFIPPQGDHRRELVLIKLLEVAMKHLGGFERQAALENFPTMWPELSQESWHSLREAAGGKGRPPQNPSSGKLIPRLGLEGDSRPEAVVSEDLRLRMPKVAQRFEVVRRRGSGAMGTVFEVQDRERGERVAMKFFRGADPELLVLFKREFRWLTGLAHPNLVSLYECFHHESFACFTMELIEGVGFCDYLRRDEEVILPFASTASEGRTEACIDFDDVRSALNQLAAGIAALHREGKLHRDIKPSNILVTEDEARVVLLDFGLVAPTTNHIHLFGADPLNQNLGGTLPYMAPEQMDGRKLNEACDWYAVGVILFEVLSGKRPFLGSFDELVRQKREPDMNQLAAALDGVPHDLAELCLGLLNPSPPKRLQEAKRGLIRPDETTRRSDVATDPGGDRLVGRDWEWQRLQKAFVVARQSEPVLVQVHGHSGMGKTALVEHFLREHDGREDLLLVRGRCYEQESSAYKGVDEIIDQLSGYLASLSREEVATILPEDAGFLGVVFPVLSRIAAIHQAVEKARKTPDLREIRRRAFAALRDLFNRLSQQKAIVIHIDDFQWCDTDSIAVLDTLLEGVDSVSLLLIASFRREHVKKYIALERLGELLVARETLHVVDVPVDELSLESAVLLAAELLQEAGTYSPDLADLIAEESRGNPLFLRELCSAGSTELRDVQLEELIGKRFRALPPEAQRFLEIIAVASQPTLRCDLVEASGIRGVEQRMESILRAVRFTRSSGSGWKDLVETYHDRIRETILAGLAPQALRDRHRSLAEALECGAEADREALAIHFEGGGLPGKAQKYYVEAAEEAAEILAFDRSASLYRKSLEVQPLQGKALSDLRVRLGDVLALGGRGFESGQTYELAVRDADPPARPDLEWRATYQFLVTGHFEEAKSGLRNLMNRVGLKMQRSALTALARILVRRMWLKVRGYGFRRKEEDELTTRELNQLDIVWSLALGFGFNEVIRAGDFNGKGLVMALRTGESSRIIRSLALEAIHNAAGGSQTWSRTVMLLERAQEIAGPQPDPYSQGVIQLGRGASYYLSGHYEIGAKSCFLAHETLQANCPAALWERDTASCYGMFSLVHLGEFSRVKRIAESLAEEAEDRGDLYLLTNIRCYPLPWALLAEDKPEKAAEYATEAIRQWSQAGFQAQHFLAWIALVECALYQRQPELAYRRIEEGWGDFVNAMLIYVQQCRIVARFLRARCALLLAAEASPKERRELLKSAIQCERKLENDRKPWSSGLACLVRAGRADLSGDVDATVQALRSALPLLEESQVGMQAAAAQFWIGVLEGETEGSVSKREAESWMKAHGVHCPQKMAACVVPLASANRLWTGSGN